MDAHPGRTLQSALGAAGADLVVIYDGDCIFCANYMKLMRLRDAVGEVRLLDARKDGVARKVKDHLNLDLDEGMMVLYGGRAYYGSDALAILAPLTSRSSVWNRLTSAVFRSESRARALYPLLKVGRLIGLKMLGRRRIEV